MWNDKATELDLLGHDKIAQTVIEIINESHLRPLTIGIYGDWGVGKSSILSLLQAKITAEKKLKISKTHCIEFNGWLFQGYEDAKSALMETVIGELARLQPADQKIQKLAKSLLHRVNWLKVAKISAGVLLTGITGLPVGGLVGQVIEKAKEATKTDSEERLLKDEEDQTVTSQIHEFRKEFKELIANSTVDHIIVLVDDLDRCLPKAVIDVLEAIRLFLFVEGTTFVISADERMIEYAVREHFPNLPVSYGDYTKNYLEKLIQIPIRLPTLNRLQTGNYIRLLMLQNHLKNDQEKLLQVYQAYEKKKGRPYDPVELSYDIVTQAIGSTSTNLKETLHVASQITPTLASGLNGNPRNIKRFLNTLFLRLKIARIYGLDEVVRLNVLAKLMLLERFQAEKFELIVNEVTPSSDGFSPTITNLEDESDANKKKAAAVRSGNTEERETDSKFAEWSVLEPRLKNVDLRPYVFVSKEKAVSFDVDGSLSEELTRLLGLLTSSKQLALRQAEKELAGLNPKEQGLLFDKLVTESRSASDISKMPASVNGLLSLMKVNPNFEERVIQLLDAYPPSALGAWAVSQLSGLISISGKTGYKKLLTRWSEQTENKGLQSIANQILKTNYK